MLEILIVIIVLVIDQVSKYLSIKLLLPISSVSLIDGFFSLTYTENKGAAFGILQDKRWFFIVLTIIITLVLVVYMIKKHKSNPLLVKISLSLVLGGAIGNLIDRIRFGYVVDMLHVTFINYPVFNIADSAVVVGTVLLAYIILFKYEELDIEQKV